MKLLTAVLLALLIAPLALAAPNPGHDPAELGPGTFGPGDFAFNGSLRVENTTNVTIFYVNTSSGRVGINTTYPVRTLDVNGTVHIGNGTSSAGTVVNIAGGTSNQVNIGAWNSTNWGLLLGYGNGALTGNYHGVNAAALINVNAGPLYLGTSNLQRFAIDSAGNVGINTTTPNQLLHVNGSANITTYLYVPNVVVGAQNNRGVVSIEGNATALPTLQLLDNVNGVHGFNFYSASGNLRIYDLNTSTYRFVIDNTGLVGINTTSPAHALDVKGNINASVALYTPQVCLNGDCRTTWPAVVGISSAAGWTNTSTVVSLATATNNVSANTLFVDNTNAKVGIGNTAPTYMLDVNGPIRSTSILYVGAISNAGNGGTLDISSVNQIAFGNGGYFIQNTPNSYDLALYMGSPAVRRMTWAATGKIGVGTDIPQALFQINESASSATKTTMTQAVTNAGLLITTNYTANAVTPGLFWSTNGNNPTKPKAGIYLNETNSGTYMVLGTSNSYATGITNDAVVIDYLARVGINDSSPTNTLDVAGTIGISDTTIIDVNRNIVNAGSGSFTGALTGATLDTGQGANELYDMNQNVQTTDTPTFNGGVYTGDVRVYRSGATTTGYTYWGQSADTYFGYNGVNFEMTSSTSNPGLVVEGTITSGGNTLWHAGNDGTGSGLDADLLDGISEGSFIRSDAADAFSGTLTMNTQVALAAGNYGTGVYGVYAPTRYQHIWSMGPAYNLPADGLDETGAAGNLYGLAWSYEPDYSYPGSNPQAKAGLSHQMLVMVNGVTYTAIGYGIWTAGGITATGPITSGGNTVWHAGNDGAGSTLDADLLDGISSASFLQSGAAGDFQLASASNDPAYPYAGLEIRELNYAGAGTGALGESPRVSFHWGGRVASQIGIDGNGVVRTFNNPGTGYEAFAASQINIGATNVIDTSRNIVNAGTGAFSGTVTAGAVTATGLVKEGGYSASDAATDNLLVNGDFEMGTTAGWTGITGVVTSSAYSGRYMASVTGYSQVESVDYIPVDPDYDVLQLEGWFKEVTTGGTPGILYFGYIAYDENFAAIGTAPCGSYCYFAASGYNIPNDGNWHKFSSTSSGEGVSFPNFPVGTKYVRVLMLMNYGASADEVTRFDHITLKRIRQGPAYIGNDYTTTNLVDQQQVSKLYTTATNELTMRPPSGGNVVVIVG
jgi:hypothetical protein